MIGMVVNSKKTAMMCLSSATNFEADAYILDSENNRIGCGNVIKALGLRFRHGGSCYIYHQSDEIEVLDTQKFENERL